VLHKRQDAPGVGLHLIEVLGSDRALRRLVEVVTGKSEAVFELITGHMGFLPGSVSTAGGISGGGRYVNDKFN
jgi:hypothetical protein